MVVIPVLLRRLNVPLRNLLATLVGLTLAVSVLVLAPASPLAAQDQEEAIAYHG